MKSLQSFFLLLIYLELLKNVESVEKIEKRALQASHELPPNEKWRKYFLDKRFDKRDVEKSLIDLIVNLSGNYLEMCTPLILYDSASENADTTLINSLLRVFSSPRVHGDIDEKKVQNFDIFEYNYTCPSYILFIEDVMDTNDVLGFQNDNKVIVVTMSSQWRVHEYLSNRISQKIVNLLIISKSEMAIKTNEQLPYVLYTHKLYIDAIASSKHVVLTSWRNGRFTRPDMNLFPKKMSEGFAGHRFTISLAHQPPFIIKRGIDSNDEIIWDGIEVRLMKLLSRKFNFTIDFREAEHTDSFGSEDAVLRLVNRRKANLGISGIFVSTEVTSLVDTSNMYYQDCAAFMTLTSTAIPRYRAIMGPFHWTVWLCLTLVYLFAIFPLMFSDKHTLKPLLHNPEEIENMFWYVFGTFTNAFTFSRNESWTNSDKIATRVFVGFYWIFTIIITACYTGSIIAFVTLPVYPETIDSVTQLLDGRYQIGTLDKAGWVNRFMNSSDPVVEKLLRKVDLVPTIDEGIRNTTKAFFWPYAFLGSKANLDYMVRSRFVPTGKRSLLHISDECLVSYGVAIVFPKDSEYANILKAGLDRIVQSGFINRIKSDVEWLIMRSSTGKLLAASKAKTSSLTVEDRALTLQDTQGMFLLLALGYVLGGISLFSEWFGGCFKLCKKAQRLHDDISIPSNPRSFNGLTPRQRTNRMKYVSTLVLANMGIIRNIQESVNSNDMDRTQNSKVVEAKPSVSKKPCDGDKDPEDLDRKIDELFNFEDVFGDINVEHQEMEEPLKV